MMSNYLFETCRGYFNWNKLKRKSVHLIGLYHQFASCFIWISVRKSLVVGPVYHSTRTREGVFLRSGRLRFKCDGTRAETRFRLSAKRTSPFKSAEATVQSTTGSRGVRISGTNAGYTMFRGSVKGTGYPLHSPVSPSLPLQCVTVYYHISTGLYH
jgi:hypothetical protein